MSEDRKLAIGDWLEIEKTNGEKVQGYLVHFQPEVGLLISTERSGIFTGVKPEEIKEAVYYDERP